MNEREAGNNFNQLDPFWVSIVLLLGSTGMACGTDTRLRDTAGS